MIDIIFPDGTKKRYSKGVKPIEIAYDISPSLSKNALSASLNNTVVELLCKRFLNNFCNYFTVIIFWPSMAVNLYLIINFN